MATDRERWADTFSADHSGGWLSGFLADEDEFDRRALWRLGSWGVGSVAAVVIALYANQSSMGMRREQVAAGDLVRQAQQIQSVARESQNETRRLASAIDTLNGDRDRLYSRISAVEQGLDTVTGSIRQHSATSPASPTPSPSSPPIVTSSNSTSPISAPSAPPGLQTASDPPPANAPSPPANTMSTVAKNNPMVTTAVPGSPAPTPSPPSTTTAITTTPPDKPGAIVALPSIPSTPSPSTPAPSPPGQIAARPEQTNNATAAAITAPPAPVTPAPATTTTTPAPTTTTVTPLMTTAAPVTTTLAPVTAAPLMPAKSIMAPPDPAAARLTEPDLPANPGTASTQQKVATANATATTEPEAGEKTEPAIAVQRTEFAVDLGGANSVDGLRALWRGLLKYRSSKVLAELRPLIVVKERNNGLGMQLRLVAGPLNDAATAAKICAAMSENSRPCETTLFDGQRLALKSENGGSSDSSGKPDSTAPAPAAVAPDRPAPASARSFHRRSSSKRPRDEVSDKDAAKPPAPKSSLSQYLGLR